MEMVGVEPTSKTASGECLQCLDFNYLGWTREKSEPYYLTIAYFKDKQLLRLWLDAHRLKNAHCTC